MLNKCIMILVSVFLFSNAAEFIKYDKAFRVVASSAFRSENESNGLALGLNYEVHVNKSLYEFSITPKYFFNTFEDHFYDSDVILEDTTYYNVGYYDVQHSMFSIEAAFLFSHRPAIRLKSSPRTLTFNLWRYGICFEWYIFERKSHDIDGETIVEVVATDSDQKSFGLIYKPAIGFQLSEKLNLSLELNFCAVSDFSSSVFPIPVVTFGSGIALGISNPVSGF